MENMPYVVNMFIHIVAVILYSGGIFYSYILINRRNKMMDKEGKPFVRYLDSFIMREPILWLYYLIVIIATGFGFGLISIIIHGKTPEIAPLAFAALIIMMILSFISFAIVLYLMGLVNRVRDNPESPDTVVYRRREENIVLLLLIIVVVILFCAVTLRFFA